MTDPPSERSTASGHNPVTIFLWAAPLALSLYVLSVGPVARFYKNKPPPPAFWITFYRPLSVIVERSEVAKAVYFWYLRHVWRLN